MNRRKRILFAIFSPIIAIIATIAMLPVASPARAQEPETICITGTNISVNPSTYLGVNQTAEYGYIVNPSNLLGPPDGAKASIYDWDKHPLPTSATCGYYGLPGVVSTVEESDIITITAFYSRVQYDNLLWTTAGTSPAIVPDGVPADAELRDFDYFTSTVPFTGSVGALMLCVIHADVSGSFGNEDIDAITVTVKGQYCYSETIAAPACDTVTDYHFTGTPTDTWTLDGSATILSSTLKLNPTGSASQTLSTTLTSGTTYNAVLSVTNAITAPVVVYLGSQSQTLTIDAAGRYTATFTATETISNPAYLLRNDGESEHYADVDWTCVYTGDTITSTISCIAPLNGEFTSADNWDWYRSAAWNSYEENAFLPFNQGGDANRALMVTTAAYSLPTLAAGQYLLLGFNASAGGGQEAIVASRVLSSWHEFNVSSGEVYTYQHDISAMAGQTATVSFVNAGDDGSAGAAECEFPAQDSVLVDNVCIYVSTAPADDPPEATSGFCPADLGFDYGCADVVPLLLGYGINVQGLDDVYATGVSVWEVQNYIPWLVAALWHNVGHPVSCFIVEFMRLAVGLVEYEVNVFANYVNWVYPGAYSSPAWLQTGFFYLARYVSNIATGQTPGGWLAWFGNSFRVVFYNLGLNQSYTISDINGHLRDAQNPFYAAANTFVSGFEGALNQIMTEVIGMWNISILPYFTASSGSGSTAIPTTDPAAPESPWKPVFDMFLWLIQFVGQIVSTLWQLFRWLVNFLTTGTAAPIDAYHSFRAGMADEAYALDVACVDDNWWCVFWGGVALINVTTAQSILYPIVITGIVCLTLVIVFKNLYEMFHIDIS